MKNIIIAAVGATLIASTSAQADELLVTNPIASYDAGLIWTGFYVGANAGYGWGAVDGTSSGGTTSSTRGIVGGVHGGYNYDFGGIVVGAEADFSFSDISYTDDISNPGITEIGRLENFGTIRARVGLPFERFMPYLTGGIAYGTFSDSISGALNLSDRQTHTGWTIGGGAEFAITDNVLVRAEYLYTDLGTRGYYPTLPGGAQNFDINASVLRAGASFKF